MSRVPALTRDLIARLPASVPDPGPIPGVPMPDDDYWARAADAILAQIAPGDPLWVFGVGSLIWNPRIPYDQRRMGLIRGWHRSFCLGYDTRYRGNPESPGIMLSLDRGGMTRGVAFAMSGAPDRDDLIALLRTEPPVPPRFVQVATAEGPVRAIAFVCPQDSGGYVGGLDEDEIARLNARAVGMLGCMPDYILNTIEHLAAEGIHDSYLWRMQEKVARHMADLPPRGNI